MAGPLNPPSPRLSRVLMATFAGWNRTRHCSVCESYCISSVYNLPSFWQNDLHFSEEFHIVSPKHPQRIRWQLGEFSPLTFSSMVQRPSQVHGVPAHPGRRQDLRLRQREVSRALGAGRGTVP